MTVRDLHSMNQHVWRAEVTVPIAGRTAALVVKYVGADDNDVAEYIRAVYWLPDDPGPLSAAENDLLDSVTELMIGRLQFACGERSAPGRAHIAYDYGEALRLPRAA